MQSFEVVNAKLEKIWGILNLRNGKYFSELRKLKDINLQTKQTQTQNAVR